MKTTFILLSFIALLSFSCKKDNDIKPVDNSNSANPFAFTQLYADRDSIKLSNSIIITAITTGNNLSYIWDVPLGVVNGGLGNEITFTGCCAGDHLIKCKVTNGIDTIQHQMNMYVKLP